MSNHYRLMYSTCCSRCGMSKMVPSVVHQSSLQSAPWACEKCGELHPTGFSSGSHRVEVAVAQTLAEPNPIAYKSIPLASASAGEREVALMNGNKPWYRKKKVWGVIAAAALAIFAPQLGVTQVQVWAAVISLLTGVVAEAIVDAAATP